MISILTTTEQLLHIQNVVNSEYRLNELVAVTADAVKTAAIWVGENIQPQPNWQNEQPPVLYPALPVSENNLKGAIYLQLGNMEKAALFFSGEPETLAVMQLAQSLQNGTPVPDNVWTAQTTAYTTAHNRAIAAHYGVLAGDPDAAQIQQAYETALVLPAAEAQKAFTVQQYALFRLDSGEPETAIALLEEQLKQTTQTALKAELTASLCHARVQWLLPPYPEPQLEILKNDLRFCLEYFETAERETDAAQILYEAAQVAFIGRQYSEALGYINRAVTLFEKHELPELAAQAQLRKANLLQAWARSGNPQFYRSAVQAYQEAIKIFNREDAPAVFADIHHQLGIIYAEIPDEIKKKGIWASVSVSSFNEALQYYNKVDHPYAFAMICNNLAQAFTQFPQALNSDNFDKALAWYREALDVFEAGRFPEERAAVLLNYLDASWQAGNKNGYAEERFSDMVQKNAELLQLAGSDAELAEKARQHAEKLETLKKLATP